jgi:hypothetical protein
MRKRIAQWFDRLDLVHLMGDGVRLGPRRTWRASIIVAARSRKAQTPCHVRVPQQ